MNTPIPRHLVGDHTPTAVPSRDPTVLGTCRMEVDGPTEAGGYQTFKIVYTVGSLGLDDTGAIQVVTRNVVDSGWPQFDNPTAPNYVTARNSGEGHIDLWVGNTGMRPWTLVITANQVGGYLREGDTITITIGDTSQGSPGMRVQTFAEPACEYRVMADVQACGVFLPLAEQLSVPILPGAVERWEAVLPTLRRPAEAFSLGIRAVDRWANPVERARADLTLRTSSPIAGLPEAISFDGYGAERIGPLTIEAEGIYTIDVVFNGEIIATAGPIVIRAGDVASYWGDLHGQSGETVGLNSIENYISFARDAAFLDVSSHQGNDFQIRDAFWAHLNKLSAEADRPGEFVFFPGYEWSGNTAIGGDHNVFFRHEHETIHRCSHALLDDGSDMSTDAPTLTDLYKALKDRDAVVYAHVGGRYANIDYDHDPLLETAVEVHSNWGSFQWILTDSLAKGRRIGVVCNSDNHDARPGASYPGSGEFGATGGLTCFLADHLDRDAIFEAMRRRHHYGTSGCRIHVDLTAELIGGGTLFHRNPRCVTDTKTENVTRVTMGDIVRTSDDHATLRVSIESPVGIERVEIWTGGDHFETVRSYHDDHLGNRIRILCSGAEYRGRGRETHWRVGTHFTKAQISTVQKIAVWNHDKRFQQTGAHGLYWDFVTTGNFAGADLWLENASSGDLRIESNHGPIRHALADIGLDPLITEFGGLERRISVQRLPSEPLASKMSVERQIPLDRENDTPIWITVVTENGHQAWTSPVYAIR